MHMNLLTETFRIRVALRSQLRHWSVIWTFCIIGSLGVCSADIYCVLVLRSELAKVRERAQSTQDVVDRSEQVKAQLAELEKKALTIQNLQPEDHGLPLLGMLTASAVNSEQNLHIHKFVMQSDRTPPQVQKTNTPANAPAATRNVMTVASIHGIATSDQAVSQLVDHLRSYDLFRRVDLKSTSVLSNSINGGREFHVECHY